MKEQPKKILISGGWGYGNIGDDAILISTVLLLKNKFPNAEITIMSFNPKETEHRASEAFPDGVKIVPSLHRELMGIFFYPCYVLNLKIKNNFFRRAYGYINRIFKNLYCKSFRPNKNKLNQRVLKSKEFLSFKDTDLFILAGGGYFNDNWEESFFAHILELQISRHLELNSVVFGLTIGPVNKLENQILLSDVLPYSKLISVRDEGSVKELKKLGIESVLSPDSALSQIDFNYLKKDNLTYVVGGDKMFNDNQIKIISSTISSFAKEYNLQIVITISRTWGEDIKMAKKLYAAIKNINNNIIITIPKSYKILQQTLGEAKIVVSQNLHGLILAWRTGVPVVSINKGRKFIGFMSQTEQSSRIFSMKNINSFKLRLALEEGIVDFENVSKLNNKIALELTNKTFKFLEKGIT